MRQEAISMMEHENKELLDFIGNIKTGINQNLAARDNLVKLVGAFYDIAEAYLEKAKTIINSRKAPKLIAAGDEHDYAQVLSHVRQHALLLGDLIRNYPVAIFSTRRRRDFQRAFILISHRLQALPQKTPVLLPVVAADFRYSHFRYMEGFGFIGIPPEMSLPQPNLDHLGVLWHEVAGYAMAVARETQAGLLKQWADDLRQQLKNKNLLDQYRQLYSDSVLLNLPKRKELAKINHFTEIEQLYKDHVLTPAKVEGNSSWQITWLLEFMEDMFFFTVVKDLKLDRQKAALNSMFTMLSKEYPASEIADPSHPPINLRLLVAMAYLGQEKPTGPLNQELQIPEDNWELAVTIAQFCEPMLPSFFVILPSPQEQKLAEAILSGGARWRRLQVQLADISLAKFDEPVDRSEKLKAEIGAATTILALLEIKFSYDDPFGGAGGGFSSFPPPP